MVSGSHIKQDAARRDKLPDMTRFALAAFMLVSAVPSIFAAELPTQSIDSFIDRALIRWEVPGLAVVVLRDGKVIHRRVAGLRDVDRNLPVTPNTLFALGSISKSFTVAGLDLLARAGKFDWDAPVTTYLPEFRLHPTHPGPAVSTRDLITHRSGMHRHDALWYLHAYTRDGLLRRLKHLPRFAPAGAEFQYSNLMVMAAGRVAGKISGGSWEKLTREKILLPLGMKHTRLGLAEFLTAPDRASGYYPGANGRIKIPARDTDAIGPAASVYSDIKDMTRWLRQLSGSDDMITAQIHIADPPGPPELGPQAYGMGLYVGSYRGHALARHPGVIDGYGALMSFMPRRKLGVMVLTNKSGGNPAPAAISHAIYDRLLGLKPADWLHRFPSSRERRDARRKLPEQFARPPSPPPLPMGSYGGAYDHPAYGRMKINIADGTTLTGRFHALSLVLQYVGTSKWRLTETQWPLREGLIFRFKAGPAGKIVGLATSLADGPTYRHNPGELYFDRVADDR
jgi:CubicO group peptidase (beta-lactamase class C family)